jgi:hypothetical protein
MGFNWAFERLRYGMRRQGHVACTKEKANAYWVWWGNPKQRDHFEGLEVEEKIKKIEMNFEYVGLESSDSG